MHASTFQDAALFDGVLGVAGFHTPNHCDQGVGGGCLQLPRGQPHQFSDPFKRAMSIGNRTVELLLLLLMLLQLMLLHFLRLLRSLLLLLLMLLLLLLLLLLLKRVFFWPFKGARVTAVTIFLVLFQVLRLIGGKNI